MFNVFFSRRIANVSLVALSTLKKGGKINGRVASCFLGNVINLPKRLLVRNIRFSISAIFLIRFDGTKTKLRFLTS